MKTQLSGGLEPTKYNGRAKDGGPSKGTAEERKTLGRAEHTHSLSRVDFSISSVHAGKFLHLPQNQQQAR